MFNQLEIMQNIISSLKEMPPIATNHNFLKAAFPFVLTNDFFMTFQSDRAISNQLSILELSKKNAYSQ